MGAGLGAAGLASGLAASHFDASVVWGLVVKVGESKTTDVELRLEWVSWWWAWSVETMDCLPVLGGGGVL